MKPPKVQLPSGHSQATAMPIATAILVACGGACVLFAWLALHGRTAAPVKHKAVVASTFSNSSLVSALIPTAVSFPALLSDRTYPTTALIVVKKAYEPALSDHPSFAPSAVSNSLLSKVPTPSVREEGPRSPLPAQHVLNASPLVTRPRDRLTQLAAGSAGLHAPSFPQAKPEREGGYRLQVSSFSNPNDAVAFAAQLRARGHKAYITEAYVRDRGLLHRVRVGPFATRAQALEYRVQFERKENLVSFLIVPLAK